MACHGLSVAPERVRRISFPPSGGGPAIDVAGDAILDSLNFAFMLGQIKLPASVDADLGLDITGWLWTVE